MVPKWIVCVSTSNKFFPLNTFCVIVIASFPERRITAMAETPWAVASATMVSLIGELIAQDKSLPGIANDQYWNIYSVSNGVQCGAENQIFNKFVTMSAHY